MCIDLPLNAKQEGILCKAYWITTIVRFTWNYNKIKSHQQDFTCVIYLQYSLFMHHQYKTKTRLVDH